MNQVRGRHHCLEILQIHTQYYIDIRLACVSRFKRHRTGRIYTELTLFPGQSTEDSFYSHEIQGPEAACFVTHKISDINMMCLHYLIVMTVKHGGKDMFYLSSKRIGYGRSHARSTALIGQNPAQTQPCAMTAGC